MSFFDILRLALRNLREAILRAVLTTIGVIVGVAVIVTMVSFGLGLQRNTVSRFKDLDLFNEITIYGRSLTSLATSSSAARAENAAGSDEESTNARRSNRSRQEQAATRVLDDAAIAEISRFPEVAYVEPSVFFTVYVRANQRVLTQTIGGAAIPNASTRFKNFVAGEMINAPDASEAVVSERWTRDFGYAKPADAINQTIEFLAPPAAKKNEVAGKDEEDSAASFFGLPLEEAAPEAKPAAANLVARAFRINGVMGKEANSDAPGGFRGFTPNASVYIPLSAASAWKREHRSQMDEVALELARAQGTLDKDQAEGYTSATVRVNDPVAVRDVTNRLKELGFASFSLFNQLDQLRTFFLIVNSALGLLGGISLLVASFGIANTMIMSIFERTREIGIMKAIGAEDREIKLIFFFEAAVIGLTGGVIGVLAAWAIDALSNNLAYRFLLKPRGASFVNFFALPPYLWLGAILFALTIAILAALYPAARAARIDPVKALRHD
jgi:ABC-type lipoprotein release transport system permease subunit